MALLIPVEIRDFIDILVSVLFFFFLLDLCCVSDTSRGLLFVSFFLMPFFFLSLQACSESLLASVRDEVGLVSFTLGFSR